METGEGTAMSRQEAGSQTTGRGSISRRELMRRAALGLGAVALLSAEPALGGAADTRGAGDCPAFLGPHAGPTGHGHRHHILGAQRVHQQRLHRGVQGGDAGHRHSGPPAGAAAASSRPASGPRRTRQSATSSSAATARSTIRSGSRGFWISTSRRTRATIDKAYKDPGTASGPAGTSASSGWWSTKTAGQNGDEQTSRSPPPGMICWTRGLAGKLDMPDPVKTGGGYIFLATQVFRFARDEEKALGVHEEPARQRRAVTLGASPQGIELVGSGGSSSWARTGGHDHPDRRQQGPARSSSSPRSRPPTRWAAVSIVKGGPNTEGAKMFVDWVLSPDGSAAERQALQPPVRSCRASRRPPAPRRSTRWTWSTTTASGLRRQQGPPDQGLASGRRYVVWDRTSPPALVPPQRWRGGSAAGAASDPAPYRRGGACPTRTAPPLRADAGIRRSRGAPPFVDEGGGGGVRSSRASFHASLHSRARPRPDRLRAGRADGAVHRLPPDPGGSRCQGLARLRGVLQHRPELDQSHPETASGRWRSAPPRPCCWDSCTPTRWCTAGCPGSRSSGSWRSCRCSRRRSWWLPATSSCSGRED